MQTLADRMRYEMGVMGFTQESLAKKTGVSQVSIQKILAGKTKRSRHILELAKALNCQAAYLMDGIESKNDDVQPVIDATVWRSYTPEVRKLVDTLFDRVKNNMLGDDAVRSIQSVIEAMSNRQSDCRTC